MPNAADVETYLANVPEPFLSLLQRIRAIVREEAPDAEEVISYGIPTFKLHGNLVHYAAFKQHCSFFPGGIVQSEALQKQLAGYKTSKGTIQFTPERPLPDALVRDIVRMRIEANRQSATEKKARKRPSGPASSRS